MRRTQTSAVLMLALVAALAVAGCGSTTNAGVGSSPGAVVHTKTVTVDGAQSTVLADANGLTLYYFTPDTATKIACTGSCASAWPPLLSPSGAPSSASALSGTLAIIRGADGAQVTYNGHPLYTYAKDKAAGDALGQGVLGKWFVATPNLAPLSGAQATPTSDGYSGY